MVGTDTSTIGTSLQGIDLYPVEPVLVIVLSLVVVGCFQWGSYYTRCNSQQQCHVRDEESMGSARRGSSIFNLARAAINFYRGLAFRTIIGFRSYAFSLAEVFIVVAYIALLFAWTFVIGSHPQSESLNWCTRAALLAASQFPLVTTLGTKNNIVTLVTRISVDKLNFLHRITARACLVFIGIHALGGAIIQSYSHTSEAELFGIVAALVFVGLTIASVRPVRERAYELFFYVHLIGVIVILIATILHIRNYSGSSFTFYVWPSFLIWMADRLIRTGRLVYFNLACVGNRKPGMLDATTELLSESLVRLKFRRPDSFCWSPGQFAYLIMPSISWLPFEAHPFSIASADSTLFSSGTKGAEDSCGKELVFLIRVKNGLTRRLKNIAERAERIRVYIDGPYGEGVDLGCHNTSLLIAGGTGISFVLPVLLNIIESARGRSRCCRRVVLIWSIRDAEFLNWVSESLVKAIKFAPPELKVIIQVFLTKSHAYLSFPVPEHRAHKKQTTDIHLDPFKDRNPFEDPPDLMDEPEGGIFSAPWLNVTRGRPNLEHILDEEISAANGKVSVSVCGPKAVAEVVRRALRSWSRPLSGGPSVTLHVASFGYS